MKSRVVTGSWVDLTFYHLFCRSVLVAGLAQAVLLFAGYFGAVWFNDYVVTQAYAQVYGNQLIDATILQFSSLLTMFWSGMVLLGLTVLVARWKGARWAAQMICAVLLCIVLVGGAFATYAASKADSSNDYGMCAPSGQGPSMMCNGN